MKKAKIHQPLFQRNIRKLWIILWLASLLSTSCTQWYVVESDIFKDAKILAIAKNEQRVVAVGSVYKEYGNQDEYELDAAIWTSQDGQNWDRIHHDDAIFGGINHQNIYDVVWTGSLFVAGGSDKSGGDENVVFWYSSDGLIWERVDHDDPVLGGDGNQFLTEMEVGSTGVVAIGQTVGSVETDLNDPVAWMSPDGMTWSKVSVGGRVSETSETVGQLPHDLIMDRLEAILVTEIVGYDGLNDGMCGHWGIMSSEDGSTHTMVPGMTILNLCGMPSAGYPVRIAYYDGYTYAVIKNMVAIPNSVYHVLVLPPDAGWGNLITIAGDIFINVFGDGQFAGSFALVGNEGDVSGMTAWVWGQGGEERIELSRMLESEERITTKAYDVTESDGVPIVVGQDFIGTSHSHENSYGMVWYRLNRLSSRD